MRLGEALESAVVFSSGLLLASIYIVRTILPFLTEELGGSSVDISRVLYISFVVMALISPLAGLISDRIGASRLLVVSSVAASLVVLMYPLTSSVSELLMVRFLHAVFAELALAAGLTLASRVTSSGRVGVGLLRASQGLGIALGPVLALILMSSGYGAAFLAASILSLTPLLALLYEEGGVRKTSLGDSIVHFLHLVRSKRLQSLVLLALSEALGFSIVVTYFVSHMVSLGLTEEGYAFFLTVDALSFSLAGYPSERLFRRFGLKFTLAAGMGLGMTFLVLALFPFPSTFVAAAPIIGVLGSFTLNPAYIEVSDLAVDGSRGFTVNSLDLLVNLSFLTLPPLELIFDTLGPSALMAIPLIPLVTSILLMIATGSGDQYRDH